VASGHKDAMPGCMDLRVDVDGDGGAGGPPLPLVLMLEAPHSLHTHIRSSLYI
jgi:hypothetical protein